ncbi:MAG: aspartate kinase [Muribaculaceae bacterium]|nr:aspartate kinase [Muribaculaceae bacterium]
MKVLKFGGTSVGSAQRIKNVAELVTKRGKNIIVLSAMSGTTNSLVQISEKLHNEDIDGAYGVIEGLKQKYARTLEELFENKEYLAVAKEKVQACFDFIRLHTMSNFSERYEKEILAQGELMSTNIMHAYLQSIGVKSVLLPALEYMRIDENGEPDYDYIKDHLFTLLKVDADIYITQGFICRNAEGDIDNLQRGGSDYSASIIGAVISAEEVQIWTDIDGMHNNDPRYVENTSPVKELAFEEAAELAYFGAKILHPTCVRPAQEHNIPVRLLNTMLPEAYGTLIHNVTETNRIKAVAAKDGITSIKIKSGRMLLACGFLKKVFEIFEDNRTAIDMVTTSEVGVSVTVDNTKSLDCIISELETLGEVTVEQDMVIVCVVGDLKWQNRGFEADVLNALRTIPVRMISYGGSNHNISVLIHKNDKIEALNLLSEHLFNK